jgi:hypothetical protein|tara:strand:- start:2383 stop:2661 length:279 start_codon:yes stop_codon:yes gene_type:complete
MQIDTKFTPANVITIILTFTIAVMAWSDVEGQVKSNTSSIKKGQIVAEEMRDNVHTLKVDVALLKQDSINAAASREEIKANQAEILKLLRNK